jgi:streptogramin lyase
MRLAAGLRRAWLPAIVLAMGLGGTALAAPVGQITEFATPTTGSQPEGIAAGPDGNLWFAELNAGKIGEIDPNTHAINEFSIPTAPSGPLGITVGPDGNIWFTESQANKIGEINPTTHAISEFTIPTAGSGPVAIVTGPNGNLWFTEFLTNQIGEINPTTHGFTEFPAKTANSGPFGIAAGPDGNIWFTEKAASKIGFINPATGTVTDFPTMTAASQPNAIADGPGGNLWFTEQAGNRVVLLNPSTLGMTEFPTPTGGPLVITPGPDGNMWFTESTAPGKIASINPAVPHMITEFATPTAPSGPVGIATGADGNLWFTENTAGKIGVIGAGASSASVTAPTVAGAPQPGNPLSCQGAVWATYAAQQPSLTEWGFDGYQWMRDGIPIGGDATSTYSVLSTDVGHQISCKETVSYALVAVTASASSAPVTVSPTLGASLRSTSTSGPTMSLTMSCVGLPSQSCGGSITLTSHVTTQGSKTIAVAAKAKKKPKPKPKKITKVRTVASGSYSVAAGKSVTVTLKLNSTGKKLLSQFYKLPATLQVSGTTPAKKTVTFRYGRLHLSPSFTWAFGKAFSFATELTVNHLPKQSKVTVICHGHGCPFSKRTFTAPKDGTLKLASALKQRHLSPHATVELEITATNVVGEVVIFTIVSGKQPTETFRCLPPGARTPTACA